MEDFLKIYRGGGIFEKISARGYTKNTPLPPIPVACLKALHYTSCFNICHNFNVLYNELQYCVSIASIMMFDIIEHRCSGNCSED